MPQYACALFCVRDMERSKAFYTEVLGQEIAFDFGENVQFAGGFALQLAPHYAQMVGLSSDAVKLGSNSAELYFDEDDLDGFLERLHARGDITFLQRCVTHPWGQRVTRFYDPDRHIIEVGERMESVIRRFLRQGLNAQETALRSQFPLEAVREIEKSMNQL